MPAFIQEKNGKHVRTTSSAASTSTWGLEWQHENSL